MFKIVGEEGFSKWMFCEENTQYKSIWKVPFLDMWLLRNGKPEIPSESEKPLSRE